LQPGNAFSLERSGGFAHLPPMQALGTIYLVGAGPGPVDLLTLRAARLIERAEIIVHDGLIGRDILGIARSDVRLISVAKQRARHTLPQEEINALLVREAVAGRDVVRLKGGDPFIFGRGGEEAEAARAAGVPVEVVPGITAANGAAASSPASARVWPNRTGRASQARAARW
jgi:uroporphyrin-III C-methyltransferase